MSVYRTIGPLVSICYIIFSSFGFKSGIWLLFAPVPVHCFSIISDDDKTVSSILSGLETRCLGLNTLGTT